MLKNYMLKLYDTIIMIIKSKLKTINSLYFYFYDQFSNVYIANTI